MSRRSRRALLGDRFGPTVSAPSVLAWTASSHQPLNDLRLLRRRVVDDGPDFPQQPEGHLWREPRARPLATTWRRPHLLGPASPGVRTEARSLLELRNILFDPQKFPVHGCREFFDSALRRSKNFGCAATNWPKTAGYHGYFPCFHGILRGRDSSGWLLRRHQGRPSGLAVHPRVLRYIPHLLNI